MQAVPFQKYWGGVVDLLKNQQDVISATPFPQGTWIPKGDGEIMEITQEDVNKILWANFLGSTPRINSLSETIYSNLMNGMPSSADYLPYGKVFFSHLVVDDGGDIVGIVYYISSKSGKWYLVKREINV